MDNLWIIISNHYQRVPIWKLLKMDFFRAVILFEHGKKMASMASVLCCSKPSMTMSGTIDVMLGHLNRNAAKSKAPGNFARVDFAADSLMFVKVCHCAFGAFQRWHHFDVN